VLHWCSCASVEKGWQDRNIMWSEQTVVGIQPRTLFPGLLAGSSGLETKFVSLPFFLFFFTKWANPLFLKCFSFILCLPYPLSFSTFLVLMKIKNDEICPVIVIFLFFLLFIKRSGSWHWLWWYLCYRKIRKK